MSDGNDSSNALVSVIALMAMSHVLSVPFDQWPSLRNNSLPEFVDLLRWEVALRKFLTAKPLATVPTPQTFFDADFLVIVAFKNNIVIPETLAECTPKIEDYLHPAQTYVATRLFIDLWPGECERALLAHVSDFSTMAEALRISPASRDCLFLKGMNGSVGTGIRQEVEPLLDDDVAETAPGPPVLVAF